MGALEDIRSWASDWGFLRGLKWLGVASRLEARRA
jgi:hypothetical protein